MKKANPKSLDLIIAMGKSPKHGDKGLCPSCGHKMEAEDEEPEMAEESEPAEDEDDIDGDAMRLARALVAVIKNK
jgi:hypothetical protein